MARRLNYHSKTNRFIGKKQPLFTATTILSFESKMPFGKYVGMRLFDIIKLDKQYLLWISKNIEIKMSESLITAINKK